MMRYVITGASGHIGNNLVRLINRERPDAEVTVLTRREIDRELFGTVCVQRIGDLFSKAYLSESIDSESVVVHLAGFIDLTDKKREAVYRVNRDLTQLVLNACEEKGARLIYVGTTDAIYREADGELSEPDAYYPEKINGNYGKSKAEASRLVLDAIKRGINGAIVIPSAVIGVNDHKPSAVGKIINGVIKGGAEIGIKGGYNFVDVEDVCRAILTLSENDLTGQWIVSGESVEVEQLYLTLNEILGEKRRVTILPNTLVKLFLPFIPQLNKITLKALGESHEFSNEKAKRELGLKPTDFAKTLSGTVDWFKENK